jgi:hypothetical protein
MNMLDDLNTISTKVSDYSTKVSRVEPMKQRLTHG